MKCEIYFQLCKSMYVLFECYKEIIFSSKQTKKLLRKHKGSIITAYDYACRFSPKKLVSKFIGIPHQRISSWKSVAQCAKSVLNKCMVKHPLQLSIRETLVLKNILVEDSFKLLPISYRWAQMVRTNSVSIAQNTFYKYARAILGEKFHYKKTTAHVPSPKADAPFQIAQW